MTPPTPGIVEVACWSPRKSFPRLSSMGDISKAGLAPPLNLRRDWSGRTLGFVTEPGSETIACAGIDSSVVIGNKTLVGASPVNVKELSAPHDGRLAHSSSSVWAYLEPENRGLLLKRISGNPIGLVTQA